MASTLFFTFLLSILFLTITKAENTNSNSSRLIALGSSLSPETANNSWLSPSGNFAFGFYRRVSGFSVGISLVGAEAKTIVWTANRDEPSVTLRAKLVFTNSGELVLKIDETKEISIAKNTTRPATFASMLDSGNFVLYDAKFDVVWESFDHPTDTILGGQILPANSQLFSGLSENDRSTGRFHLKMQVDGNLVLYPTNTEDSSSDAYWATDTFDKGKFHLFLNHSGVLTLIDGEDKRELNVVPSSANNGQQGTTIYRATIDVDGVFRLYSHAQDENGKFRLPTPIWSALGNPCEVKGYCGLNSYCTYNDALLNCLCLPGTDYADESRKTLGCLRNYTELGCRDGKENAHFHSVTRMENMMWGDMPYSREEMAMEDCGKSCLEDCNCGAALFRYKDGTCSKQKIPLVYVRRDLKELTTAFLKLGNETHIRGENGTGATVGLPGVVVSNKNALVQILALALGFISFSCLSLAVAGIYAFKIRVLRYKRLSDVGALGTAGEDGLALRVFSYSDLKRATDGFKEELGKGSFGAVYKGSFDRGKKKHVVAVKRLEKLVEEGEKEFRAEMRAIGRTNHRNLVRLLGYCAEDSKRLLVYEYMSNGSLAELLFAKDAKGLDWDERVRVAVDIARGILYLHEECKNPIIHCDIKPQNILIDEFWTAKISDFGLAKLLMPDQTRTFTMIRGTRGYLAPEWHKNTPISVKADVYSFGIMLMEIVCCRKSLELKVPKEDEVILASWVYKCFTAKQLNKLVIGEEVDKKTLENMVKVALWCIQDEPALRPSMKSVVLMLEGITDVSIPPCPTSSSM